MHNCNYLKVFHQYHLDYSQSCKLLLTMKSKSALHASNLQIWCMFSLTTTLVLICSTKFLLMNDLNYFIFSFITTFYALKIQKRMHNQGYIVTV